MPATCDSDRLPALILWALAGTAILIAGACAMSYSIRRWSDNSMPHHLCISLGIVLIFVGGATIIDYAYKPYWRWKDHETAPLAK